MTTPGDDDLEQDALAAETEASLGDDGGGVGDQL